MGSFAHAGELAAADPAAVAAACDVVEIRLDLMGAEAAAARPWKSLISIPLLFTARRGSEGGAGDLGAAARAELLSAALPDASLIDLEVASIPEMAGLVEDLKAAETPWIASFHSFDGPVPLELLNAARMAARAAGAAGFKAAIELGWETGTLADLAYFLKEDRGYPISLMGMGPLAPVSRLLFAQLGSVLNYGFLGSSPTAPGQWSAARLKEAISNLALA